MASEAEFFQVFELLAAAYPHFSPVPGDDDRQLPGTIDVYREALADLPFEILRVAALKCLADSKFFPSVAELRAAVADITQPARRSGLEAWGDVLKGIDKFGYNCPPDGQRWAFKDPLVAQVVERIGWRSICLTPEDDQMPLRAHFIKAYEQMQSREHEAARQLPLVLETRAQLEAARTLTQVTARLASPALLSQEQEK